MASVPQPTLPLFYNDLMPLNSRDHAKYRTKPLDGIKWLVNQHAVPLTTDEFIQAQRNFPIVFSSGENGVPLALMGLNEGVNVFFDEQGVPREEVYLPAYARRYPYMLARLTPEAEDLTLCFDPTSEAIGEYEDGEALFDGEGKLTDRVQAALDFCEQFEQSGARTQALITELNKHDLLMDGEIAITPSETPDKPYIYRGFRMINEEKLRNLDPAVCQQWVGNGIMAVIFAHLFSLEHMRAVFGRQMAQGKVPEQTAEQPAA